MWNCEEVLQLITVMLLNSTVNMLVVVFRFQRSSLTMNVYCVVNCFSVLLLALLIARLFCHLQVKKVVSQTIITMAHHRYLEMEGGQLMIDFVVRQCALPPDPVSR